MKGLFLFYRSFGLILLAACPASLVRTSRSGRLAGYPLRGPRRNAGLYPGRWKDSIGSARTWLNRAGPERPAASDIPKSFSAPHKQDFDTDYMRQLFQTGYDLAAQGYPWEKLPPGL